ncbi:nitroreductase/quinone reductase family protein [Pedococcus sp. 2YAF34]|uniref:nitroreductase/quinone reductase family protein n=1 Tax=Pedococcus sp. 2YAF34 TaxID=3233032 RepID=UPI003F9CC276
MESRCCYWRTPGPTTSSRPSAASATRSSFDIGTLERFTARARVATDAERDTLWPMMARIFPLYDDYARKTDRQIPLVLLTPGD